MRREIFAFTICFLLLIICFSGCTEVKEDSPEISVSTTLIEFDKILMNDSFIINLNHQRALQLLSLPRKSMRISYAR